MAKPLRSMYISAIGTHNYTLLNAFKMARIRSHLQFLKRCLHEDVIPQGFIVEDKLRHTIKNADTTQIMRRHSRQWMQLAIDSLYRKSDSECVATALNLDDFNQLEKYKFLLREIKRSKLNKLLLHAQTEDDMLSTLKEPFKNLSSADFPQEQFDMLQKGPAYVPPPKPINDGIMCGILAEIQAAFYRMKYKDDKTALSAQSMEFFSGLVHTYEQVRRNKPPTQWQTERKSLRHLEKTVTENGLTIINSDKTKRLIAMNTNEYRTMTKAALNDDDKKIPFTQPTTTQQKIKKSLKDITRQYPSDSELHKRLSKCNCSEPLPNAPYALPKDHKPGIPGRPIISSIDSGTRDIQRFLSTLLQPLVEQHVPAHLRSTEDFINRLQDFQPGSGDFVFASLDVVNLYGNIPIQSSECPNLLSCVTTFFDTHKQDSSFPELKTDDLVKLIRLTTQDCYILDGDLRMQSCGIAMGNCAAPVLASIFMHFVERGMDRDVLFWARYVDDIFLIYQPDQDILTKANSLHPAMKFTLEEAVCDSLPFLDTSVHYNREHRKFEFSLHVKNMHSNSCLPFSSFVPMSRKRSLLIGENHRVNRNSSLINLNKSKAELRKRFLANGYNQKIVGRLFDSNVPATQRSEEAKHLTFIKLPFYGEKHKRNVMNLARQCEVLDKVRIIFTSERPLSLRFRDRRELPKCPEKCWTCAMSIKKDCCFKKFAVYELCCSLCDCRYIGQTNRTMKSRLREHCKTASSAFYQHAFSEHQAPPESILKWRILRTERNLSKRKALESIFISRERHKLVNGCSGDSLLPFIPASS